MISLLSGEVHDVSARGVVVSVQGVGFLVHVPERTAHALQPGEDTQLYTTLIVREDDLSLYGFATQDERDTFDLLCGVNGVGPKSALGVLSSLSVADIAHAVATDDDATFRQVSGIGPKTAKLITLSLHGKLQTDATTTPDTQSVDSRVSAADHTAIVQALVGLGWSERAAKKGVSDVLATLHDDDDVSVGGIVKKALLVLGPHTSREANR